MIPLLGPFLLLIITGWLAGRLRILGQSGLDALTVYLITIALPAMFVSELGSLDIPVARFALYLSIFFVSHLSILLAGMVWHRRVCGAGWREAVFLGACGAWPNSGYIGLVVATALLGSQGVLIAAGSLIMEVLVVGTALVIAGEDSKGSPVEAAVRGFIQATTRNTFFAGMVLGVIIGVFSLPVPQVIADTLDYLGRSVMAIALFSVGLGMALRPVKLNRETGLVIGSTTVFKLVLAPALTFVLATAVGLEGLERTVVTALSAMPSAVNTFLFAARYRVAEARNSTSIMVTTLLSFVTLGFVIGW